MDRQMDGGVNDCMNGEWMMDRGMYELLVTPACWWVCVCVCSTTRTGRSKGLCAWCRSPRDTATSSLTLWLCALIWASSTRSSPTPTLSKSVAETAHVWKPTLINYFASESQWQKWHMFENPHWSVTLPIKVSGRNCRCFKTHTNQLLCQWKSVAETADVSKATLISYFASEGRWQKLHIWKPNLKNYFACQSWWQKLQMFENPHYSVTLPVKVSGTNCRCLKTHTEQLLCQPKSVAEIADVWKPTLNSYFASEKNRGLMAYRGEMMATQVNPVKKLMNGCVYVLVSGLFFFLPSVHFGVFVVDQTGFGVW